MECQGIGPPRSNHSFWAPTDLWRCPLDFRRYLPSGHQHHPAREARWPEPGTERRAPSRNTLRSTRASYCVPCELGEFSEADPPAAFHPLSTFQRNPSIAFIAALDPPSPRSGSQRWSALFSLPERVDAPSSCAFNLLEVVGTLLRDRRYFQDSGSFVCHRCDFASIRGLCRTSRRDHQDAWR